MLQNQFLGCVARLHTCGECAKYLTEKCPRFEYKDYELNVLANPKTAKACKQFVKKRKKKTWKLDLEAEQPKTFEPCGFYEDMIIECAWLPYRNEKNEVENRPSLVVEKQNGKVEIYDFLSKDLPFKVQGTFPSADLPTLMTAKAVKMLLENVEVEPYEVDMELDKALTRHISIGNKRRILLKRWIEGTYFYDVFESFPILNVMGVSESGKSRILKVVQAVSYHAQGVVDPTPASIFRIKEEDKATLCFDEAEYLNDPRMNQTIRTLINASYSKGLAVPRYDEIDGKRVKRKFNLYSPFAIVGISGLHGVTASRAIRIVTERANRDFPTAKTEEYANLRDKLYVLRFRKAFEVKRIYDHTDISDFVTARFVELFKPIFALTRLFGNETEYEQLKEWSSEYQNVFRVEALNLPEEEQVLNCLAQLKPLPDDWYSLKELTEKVNLTYSRQLSYQTVSRILTRIGVTERRRVKGATQFRVTRTELERIAERLGINLPEQTEPKTGIDIFGAFCRFRQLYRMIDREQNVEKV